MKLKTIMFDVCGVLGDARGKVPWKIKVAMEEARLCEKYGIGFNEIMTAYAKGGFDSLWRRYKVNDPDRGQYFVAWDAVPEYPPGSVVVYPEVPFVFNKLLEADVDISLLTRLTCQNVTNVLREIKRRGFKGDIEDDIKVFNPKTDNVRKSDKAFVEKVMYKAYKETQAPRAYIDDGLQRVVHLREWDRNLFTIGSARGFFCVKYLQTIYCRKSNDGLIYKNFDSESDATKEGYFKIFNKAITNLEEIFEVIDIPRGDE